MRDYHALRDKVFSLVLAAPDQEIQAFCSAEGVPVVDASSRLVFSRLGRHWTPQGHHAAAQRIREYLSEASIIP